MKRCRYCGAENDDNDNFCAECGKSLAEYKNEYKNNYGKIGNYFINVTKDIFYLFFGAACTIGVTLIFLYYSYSRGNDNSETIFQQIVYLVNHYGDVHSLGIGLLIGITFFNIIMSFDIQKQLAKIRNILNEKK